MARTPAKKTTKKTARKRAGRGRGAGAAKRERSGRGTAATGAAAGAAAALTPMPAMLARQGVEAGQVIGDRYPELVAWRRGVWARLPEAWRARFALFPYGYCPVATCAQGDTFDTAAAEHAIGFWPAVLKHVEGAAAGQPYELQPWEMAIIGALFGWRRADGTRRFRLAFIYVPKKNSKTTLSSGIVLYLLTQDGERSPKVFSAAASRDQAALVFSTVAGMIKQAPAPFRAKFRVYGDKGGSQQKSITVHANAGTYRPLAADADTADGQNVYAAIVDELHRHKDGELMDILIRGTSARTQPLIVIITTADYDRESACNAKHAEAHRVIDNAGDPDRAGYDPSLLPVIYEAQPTDDWTDPAVWAKANPNLNVSKSLDYMRRACELARHDPVAKGKFLRLDLNIRVQQTESLIDLTQWDNCEEKSKSQKVEKSKPDTGETPVPHDPIPGPWAPGFLDHPDIQALREACRTRRRYAYAAFDLGQRDDLAAICLAIPPEEKEEKSKSRKVEKSKPDSETEALETENRERETSDTGADTGADAGDWDLFWWCFCPIDMIARRDVMPVRYRPWQESGHLLGTVGNDIDFAVVRKTIITVNRDWNVVCWGYDPWSATQLSQELHEQHGIEVAAMRQGAITLSEPTKRLISLVRTGRLRHHNNPLARWAAGNTVGKTDHNSNVVPVKDLSKDKIDPIVAAVMAIGRGLEPRPRRSVYTQRGLRTL